MRILLVFLAILLCHGRQDESQCPINCQKCSGINMCDFCKRPNYFLRNVKYCTQCITACRTCSSWTQCILCENGYVLSQAKCQPCSENCASCSLPRTCDRCNTGYYVTNNQYCYHCPDRCSTCSNWTNCQSCIHGYYLQESDNYCHACPENCETCKHNSYCYTCKAGFYGHLCNYICPEGCPTCSSQYKCNSCHTGFYLHYNYQSTNWRCKECPARCATCTGLDKCGSCSNGFYISNDYCHACPKNCKACEYNSFCYTCKAGFYGHLCNDKCPEGCLDKECYQDDGVCSRECVVGLFGQFCNVSCSKGCHGKECNKQTGRCVKGCLDGYYGETCQRCSEWCLNMTCEKADGRCTHGCVDGYYEYERRCEKCSDNCKTCSSTSTCASCYDGSYKYKCDTLCPYCKPGGCYFLNGTCIRGCRDGYYEGINMCLHCPDKCYKCKSITFCEECQSGYFGKTCEQRCFNNCLSCSDNNNCKKASNALSSCYKENGTCLYGCVSGFTGHNCTEEMLTSQQRTLVLGITCSALGVVLVSAAVVLLLVRSRRNKVTISPVCVDSNPQHVRRSFPNPTYNAYIGIANNSAGSEVKPDSDDHVYAVVQKVQLKQKPASGIDKSEADDNVYDVTSTDRPPAKAQRHTRSGAAKTGDDTYSHISHVNKMGRFVNELHVDCETVYDHVSHDEGLPCNERTYNVAGSIQSQSCGRRTERMRTNSPNLVDVMQDEDDTYSHTNQRFVTSNTDHATYNTTCDLMLPQSMKDDQAD